MGLLKKWVLECKSLLLRFSRKLDLFVFQLLDPEKNRTPPVAGCTPIWGFSTAPYGTPQGEREPNEPHPPLTGRIDGEG